MSEKEAGARQGTGVKSMLGILVVTHGRLAMELVNAARMIVGDLENVQAVSIGWNDDATDARDRIGSAMNEINRDRGILILTDMFGGTPTNIALTFLEKERVEVLTGVNLPMLIKLSGTGADETLTAVAQKIRAQGQKSIYVASEVLARMEE